MNPLLLLYLLVRVQVACQLFKGHLSTVYMFRPVHFSTSTLSKQVALIYIELAVWHAQVRNDMQGPKILQEVKGRVPTSHAISKDELK